MPTINNQRYTQWEAEIACALEIWVRVSNETIGVVLGFMRNGVGAPAVPCAGLATALQRSQHASHRELYARVANDRAYREAQARQVYRNWWNAQSLVIQRFVVALSIRCYNHWK